MFISRHFLHTHLCYESIKWNTGLYNCTTEYSQWESHREKRGKQTEKYDDNMTAGEYMRHMLS